MSRSILKKNLKNLNVRFKIVSITLLLLLISLIQGLGCKKSESRVDNVDKPVEIVDYMNYVINPNGIALYKKAGDLESKHIVISRGEGIELFIKRVTEGEVIKIGDIEWTRVRYKGEEFFYIGSSFVSANDSDFIQMELQNPNGNNSAHYAVVQKEESYLYEFPFADSKKMEKLELFSLLEILKANSHRKYRKDSDFESQDEPNWLEVKTNSNKIGFVYEGIARYSEKKEAESAIKDKQILERGFIRISRNSNIVIKKDEYSQNSGKGFNILKEQEFIPVHRSRIVNKKRAYFFDTYVKTNKKVHKPNKFHRLSQEEAKKGRLSWDGERWNGFVSEDQGVYFSNRAYTKHTFENTNYKGDSKPLEILYHKALEENEGFDFREFQFKPISINKDGNFYYKAKFYEGYERSEKREEKEAKYFIFKKNDGKYELVSDSIEPYASTDFVDLDNDGIQEMIVTQGWRVVEYKTILTLQNGVYKEIPQMNTHEHNFIVKGHRIYKIGRNTDAYGKNGKDVEIEYQFSKGKLIPK